MEKQKRTLDELLSGIEDPRINRRKLHELSDIILLTLLGVLCGAESYESIELFGKSKETFLKDFLKLPNGIPSHDTIERLFKRLNPEQFERFFIQWVKQLETNSNGKLINIDGKTIRGSQDEINGRHAIHIVSAWCNENNIVLAQLKTHAKSNEIEIIPQLIELIDMKASTITIDAMGCQKKIAEAIVNKEADYILAVKDNQKQLHEHIKESFRFEKPDDRFTTTSKDHGRIEKRECDIITNLEWIDEKQNWKGLQTIIRVHCTTQKKNKTEEHTRYYISSKKQSAKLFNENIRGHWAIENSLHWVLDVQFQEDLSRKRKDNAAENFTVIRRIALNCIQNTPKRRLGVNNRRLLAGWDNQYLADVLANLKF